MALVAAALAACCLPVRRAASIDPADALRMQQERNRPPNLRRDRPLRPRISVAPAVATSNGARPGARPDLKKTEKICNRDGLRILYTGMEHRQPPSAANAATVRVGVGQPPALRVGHPAPRSRERVRTAFARCERLARLSSRLEDARDVRKMTLARAASIAGLERKYFSVYFRKHTGVSFSAWMTSVRLERAIDRMKTTDASLTTIAFDAGFHSVSSFERAFKRILSRTPRDVAAICRS